ncbi:Phosphate regulon sensor protein PhoR (SphS) [Lunatimonas lonarensis]|uniref:histidine kinase n=1 Tax=Lunatimonas lonarensis TaxID=1232681 RepID=R7ZP31_9BACT|nr:ATP-binding protein [Lunatimonas lonarensis]EON75865.1 Phosphate regulon sensor protein PhoR (SphS) [Lunatimonas lonarensis]
MLNSSKGIALLLALGITTLVLACLSLLEDVTPTLMTVMGTLTFAVSYLLIYIVLHFLIFEEISNIYRVLEKIQKKNPGLIETKRRGRALLPLSNLQGTIDAFATAKNREIEILQQNETFRREFIGDISHELKTPIFAAQGYIHTLLDGAVDDLSVRDKFLKRAAKSLGNLEKLVQDLITLNQMESGMVKFHMTEFDLKETVHEVLEQLEDKANRRNVRMQFQAQANGNFRTFADRDKIFRVVQNLVSNAIKYNKEEGKVTVQLKAGKNRLRLKVRDEGKGIPPEDLKRIFERFYRVDKSRSKEQGGTGLGLAIVKHILEGHKSKISVSSAVGEGSVFSFDLPLQTKAEGSKPKN